MIPRRLRLHNFMSYGEDVPPLDFSQITTACLTGDNGHGKSTLLDAITWVLWGQTRAKNLDDVVRLGQVEAEVEFEFDLEGQRYRALRKRSLRTRAGLSSLELQGFDPKTQRFQAISGNSIRETEAKIVQLLHMNYDTFINSVFILQGRADEFTNHRPGERKRILSEILGLSVFDNLELRARTHRNELDQEVRTLQVRVEELEQEVARKPELAAAVTLHQDTLSNLQAGLKAAQERFDHLQQRHQQLALQSQQAQEVERRLQQLRQEELDLGQQLQTHRQRMADDEAVLAQEAVILETYQTLQRLKQDEQVYGARAQEYATLQQRQATLQHAIVTDQHRLELEHQRAQQHWQDLNDKLQSCDAILAEAPRITHAHALLQAARQREAELSQALQQRYALEQEKRRLEERIQQKRRPLELEQHLLQERQKEWQQKDAALSIWQERTATLRHQLLEVEQHSQRLDQVRAEGVSLRVQIETHIPQTLQGLQQEIADHTEKHTLLKTAGAHCPLCEKALSDGERRQVMQKLMHEITKRSTRLQTLQEEQRQLQARRQVLRDEFKHLERQVDQRQSLEQQMATTQANLDEASRAHDELVALLQALRELDANLSSGHYAAHEITRLQHLTTELANLTYDPQAHERLKRQIAELTPIEVEKSRLEQATADRVALKAQQPQLAEHLATSERILQSQQYALAERTELDTVAERLAHLDFNPAAYQSLRQQLRDQQHVERHYHELETARKHLQEARHTLQTLQAKQQHVAQEIAMLELEQQRFARDLQTQQDLQTALGEAEAELHHLREREGEQRLALGRAQSHYEHCVQREAELQQRTVQRDRAMQERTLYGDLAQMFGKNGIQAIIIENAIPELEDEANHILGRVTDNAMHLTLETQRDTRSGNVAETLDIKISDTLGTRNYELFSGGEAFRINIALRIALSKLLARRAGARLRTLVIDEGFGTQDSQGLERLVEVIKAIREDFAKIIVITHLRELKNAFDTHIEVKKDPLRGSSYQVV